MEKNRGKKWKIYLLRAGLTLLCVLTLILIFSNSLQSGEKSSGQSSAVTDAVQDVAGVIAPDSGVANATGTEYDKLHMDIRTLAHFGEFALLGALLIFCYFSYTRTKSFLILPLSGIVLTPFVDECLQMFATARAAELKDVLVDTAGGVFGVVLAVLALVIGGWLYRRRRAKKQLKKRLGSV